MAVKTLVQQINLPGGDLAETNYRIKYTYRFNYAMSETGHLIANKLRFLFYDQSQ